MKAMKNIARSQTKKSEKFTTEIIGVVVGLVFLLAFLLHHQTGKQTATVPTLSPLQQAAVATKFQSVGTTESGKLVAAAKQWAGREFMPGQDAMCARFIHSMIKEAGLRDPGVTTQPLDGMMPTSPDLANGLAGADIGTIIKDQNQVQAGDIIFWQNTYGNYPNGTITHVGIAVGNGKVVDRPTASAPVKHRDISDMPREGGGNAFHSAVRIDWSK